MMKGFEAAFAKWVVNNRTVVMLLSAALVGGLSVGMGRLYFDSSYRVFFSKDNPQLRAFETMERTFSKADNVVFVLAPSDKVVFKRDTLKAIEELTTEAWQLPYSNRVDSITNFQFTEAFEDDLVVRDMVKDAPDLSDDALAKARQATLTEPALLDRLINKDASVTAVAVTVQIPDGQRTMSTLEITAFARDVVAKFVEKHPDINVYLTGMVLMDNAFTETAMRDSTVLVPISFGMMIAIIAILVGGFFGTFATVVIITGSILASLGAGGFLGFPMTGQSTSAPIIILTVAVANCVHLLTTYLHDLKQGKTKVAAMEESLRINLQPVFLASITTAIGFLTMNFSEVPPFRHLGNMVSVGVVVSFLLTVTFLPAFMTLVPARARAQKEDDYGRMDRLADFVIRKRKALLWTCAVVIVLLVANIPRNELNDNFVHYFGKSIPFRNDTDFMMENLTGIYIIDASLNAGSSGGISDPKFLNDVERFAQWVEQQPKVVHVDRFTNIMKRLNKNMHADEQAYYKLPEDRDLAAQYLLLYEMSLPYGLDLNNQINVDKSATRVSMILRDITSNEMIQFSEAALAWADENLESVEETSVAGTILMFSHIGYRNIRAVLFGNSVALILISGILIVSLRSPRIGVVSLLPNLAPAAVSFGLWGIFDGEVGLSLSLVVGMSFGIIVDNAVHFLSKYLRARREKDLDPTAAVRYAFRTVGRALTITTSTLVVGFGVLATSALELNSGMGLLAAVIIGIALLGTFFLLPPLIMKIEEKDIHASSNDSPDGPAGRPVAA